MSNPVQKGFSGWLIKRGGFNKGWKKRWFSYKQPRMTRTSEGMFAVRKACIQYFVSPENTKPKGKIIMEDIIDVTPATNFHNVEDLDVTSYSGIIISGATYKFAFNIITSERTYYISAEFADDLIRWLKIFYAAPKVKRKLTGNNLSLYLPRRPDHIVYKKNRKNSKNSKNSSRSSSSTSTNKKQIYAIGVEDVLKTDHNYMFANACVLGTTLPREGIIREELAYTIMSILSDNGEDVKCAETFFESLLDLELSVTASPGMIFRTDTNATRFIVAYVSHLCRTNGIGGFYQEVIDPVLEEIMSLTIDDNIDIDRNNIIKDFNGDELPDSDQIDTTLQANAIRLAEVVDKILDRALAFVPNCIGALRRTFERIVETAKVKFPNYEYVGLSNIFVLRVMTAPLIRMGWNPDNQLNENQKRMLALVTKLLNSVSIKQGPGNENGTSSFGRKNEGYFKIMHQFYPTLENKMMRFLHEMAIHDENPHSPMRRRTMIWHIPEDMSIFRSFVYDHKEDIRLSLLSSVLVQGKHNHHKLANHFTAIIAYLHSDMRLSWDEMKKSIRLNRGITPDSPFRTKEQKKMRFSNVIAPEDLEDYDDENNDGTKRKRKGRKKKKNRQSFVQRLAGKIVSSSTPRTRTYSTSQDFCNDDSASNDDSIIDMMTESPLLTLSSISSIPKLQSEPVKSEDQPIGVRKYDTEELLQTTIRNDIINTNVDNMHSMKDEPGHWEKDEEDEEDEEEDNVNGDSYDTSKPNNGYLRAVDIDYLGRTWVNESLLNNIDPLSINNDKVIILDEEASHASTKDLLKVNPISKVSKWSLNPIRKARQKVSLKKNRFIHDGFDLDLTYITNKVIAMGFPCEGTQSLYRNSLTDTVRFLNYYHKNHYMIYNLCQEREYDCKKFDGRVIRFPFADHNACPLPMILQFRDHAKSFLEKDRDNVIAVHCKAGKGRTGLFICCLLSSSGLTSLDAMNIYATRRTRNNQGVTIPSQRIYVDLFKRYVNDVAGYNERLQYAKNLKHIDLHGMILKHDEYVFFQVLTPSYHHGYEGKHVPLPSSDETILYDSRLEVGLVEGVDAQVNLTIGPLFGLSFKGDVRLVFYKVHNSHSKKFFQCWINSTFLKNDMCIRPKRELDGAIKDKKNKKFHRDFYMKCVFESMTMDDTKEEQMREKEKNTNVEDEKEKELVEDEQEEVQVEDAKEMVQMNGEEKTTNGEEDDNEPFFDVDGEHKDDDGMVLGGDALVAQYLKLLGEDEEEEDDDEEEDDEEMEDEDDEEMEDEGTTKVEEEYVATKGASVPLPPPPPPPLEEVETKTFLPKRQFAPSIFTDLAHLTSDIQFDFSPIATRHKEHEVEEELRRSLRLTSSKPLGRRVSKRSSPVRKKMLRSDDSDDIWLANRIAYQMPRGSHRTATFATTQRRRKQKKKKHKEALPSPRGVAHTHGHGNHRSQSPLILHVKPRKRPKNNKITAVDYGRKRLPRSKYDYLNRSVASQQQRKRLTGSPTMPIDFYHLTKRKLGNLSPTMTSIYH